MVMTETKQGNVKQWYVVKAVSGQEKKVKTYIENEITRHGLAEYVSQVLVPTEKVYQIKNGKKVSRERNYFPGYILIEAALIGEVPHTIKSVTGVLGFLGERGEPVPLRMSEVNRILGKVDELTEAHAEINVPFIVGETVKIVNGAFNSFTGEIAEINEEKKKIKVIVKIFGRKQPVELGFLEVAKA
jgi:transcriptional antiterminator NusG